MTILKNILPLLGKNSPASGCRGCGTCCEVYGPTVTATESDILRWDREGRGEITAWITAPQERRAEPCPFLARSGDGGGLCAIQETKPQMCRDYPTKAHRRICVMRIKHPEGENS